MRKVLAKRALLHTYVCVCECVHAYVVWVWVYVSVCVCIVEERERGVDWGREKGIWDIQCMHTCLICVYVCVHVHTYDIRTRFNDIKPHHTHMGE